MNAPVVPYDPSWPSRFSAERERLKGALGPWLTAGIHHVGSTAVPGLAAKPIIDMIAGVRELEEARAASEALSALGYTYREHRPEAHAFEAPERHLHLTESGSDLWRERLAFRDALRADPRLASEYERWKLAHLALSSEAGPYSASKTPFVARVLAREGIRLKPDGERRSTPAENQS